MPKSVSVSVDEFIGKRSLSTKDGVVYRAAKMPKTFDAESRSATFIMTDETVDSYGDVVRAKGCKLDRFENNPICLLNHRSDQILGTWSDVKRIVKRIEGTATLAKAGTAPHIDMAYNLMSQGILRAASIGFVPLKLERILDEDNNPTWSYDILEWEMYECSVVSIPANPSALAKSMKEGSMMARDLLEEVLDNYVKMPSGVIVAIADIEAAHKAGGGEKTVVVVEKSIEEEAAPAAVEKEAQDAPEAADAPETEKAAESAVEKDAAETVDVDPVEKDAEVPTGEVPVVEPEKKTIGAVIEVDTTEATEKVNALSKLFDSLAEKMNRFFGTKAVEPEVVEPPAPPSVEAIEAARSKAAAIRDRLATKGLIEA